MALHVAQLVTSLARGGAQATVLGSSQDCPGVEVTVLAGPDDPGEGTYWKKASHQGIRLIPVPSLHRSVMPRSDAAALSWLIRWLRETRPDVLHTHSAKAGLLGRLAAAATGTPVVHTVHGWSTSSVIDGRAAAIRRQAVVRMERALARTTEALVVVTSLDAEEGLRNRIGSPEQYHVIRSGIDVAASRRGAAMRAEWRGHLRLGDRFTVGTVGRLADQKDISALVSGFAAAGIDQAELVIVGDGPLRLDLKRQVSDLGLGDRTRFLGHRDDAAELVAAFDVFVSTARWEGLPRTVIEAMAAGVPVIATPVGGVPEVVVPGVTGCLVPVAAPGAVAEALLAHLAQPEHARRMAIAAAGQVETFTVERMRADLVSLWHAVVDRSLPGVSEADAAEFDPAKTGVRVG